MNLIVEWLNVTGKVYILCSSGQLPLILMVKRILWRLWGKFVVLITLYSSTLFMKVIINFRKRSVRRILWKLRGKYFFYGKFYTFRIKFHLCINVTFSVNDISNTECNNYLATGFQLKKTRVVSGFSQYYIANESFIIDEYLTQVYEGPGLNHRRKRRIAWEGTKDCEGRFRSVRLPVHPSAVVRGMPDVTFQCHGRRFRRPPPLSPSCTAG